MRKKIVAGNWKMNTNLNEGIKLARDVDFLAVQVKNAAAVVICVPFIHLSEVKKVIKKAELGAQNCASEASGAFTGEVSANDSVNRG